MPSRNFAQKIDSARALAMYDEGASDAVIAKACGVSASGICYWRRKHGLPRTACNDNRLTSSQIRQAKNMLRNGATRAQVAAYLGISVTAVQRLRREMSTTGLRPTGVCGITIRKAVIKDEDLPRRIEKAIGMRVPRDIRLEAVNDMYLELLDGRLRVDQIESAAPRFRSRAFSMNCFNYSTRSINEEDENGFSIADTLADPNSLAPFDEILERAFANDD